MLANHNLFQKRHGKLRISLYFGKWLREITVSPIVDILTEDEPYAMLWL